MASYVLLSREKDALRQQKNTQCNAKSMKWTLECYNRKKKNMGYPSLTLNHYMHNKKKTHTKSKGTVGENSLSNFDSGLLGIAQNMDNI